mmetsp:Transcript_1761/g.5783  ORF Transcript_1761/g.5783 Transcript_1761/m.5783 type:complete len:269 (+) Transcript_1761:270-1076(+)
MSDGARLRLRIRGRSGRVQPAADLRALGPAVRPGARARRRPRAHSRRRQRRSVRRPRPAWGDPATPRARAGLAAGPRGAAPFGATPGPGHHSRHLATERMATHARAPHAPGGRTPSSAGRACTQPLAPPRPERPPQSLASLVLAARPAPPAHDRGFSFFSRYRAMRATPDTLTTLKRTPGMSPTACPLRPNPAISTSSFSSMKLRQPSLGTKAAIFLPFLMSWARTHLRMALLGCLASMPIFSRTMPLQCEDPPKGLHLYCVPRCAFL